MKLNNIYKNREYITRSGNYNSSAVVVYQHLIELQRKQGYCFASDAYLANICGLSKSLIQKIISQFKNDGFIKRETNGLNRKIYLIKDVINPEFEYIKNENKDEKDEVEESVIESVIKEPVEDIIENVMADLPDSKPPSGMFGPKLRKQTKKTKEQKANERSLNNTFNELVVDVYPADKRGSVSKAFTVFKNLKFDDQQEVLRNIKRYVDMIASPYHKNLINCLNDGAYKDDYLDAREKSNKKRTSKTESSTAHNFDANIDDYYTTTSERLNK